MEAMTFPFQGHSPMLRTQLPLKENSKTNVKSSSLSTRISVHPTMGKKMDGAPKPKQSKSRNGKLPKRGNPSTINGVFAAGYYSLTTFNGGCITCKNKRLKCDEIKPTCQQCIKRNVPCGGYKKEFKWRTFEEATFNAKPVPVKAKKSTSYIRQLYEGLELR